MENKSKCCGADTYKVFRGLHEVGYTCSNCGCSHDYPTTQQKNTGLTLSEIAADEDVEEATGKGGMARFYRRSIEEFGLAGQGYTLASLAATDWIVTKRKSDEAKKEPVQDDGYDMLEKYQLVSLARDLTRNNNRLGEENLQLKAENEKLKEQRRIAGSIRDYWYEQYQKASDGYMDVCKRITALRAALDKGE